MIWLLVILSTGEVRVIKGLDAQTKQNKEAQSDLIMFYLICPINTQCRTWGLQHCPTLQWQTYLSKTEPENSLDGRKLAELLVFAELTQPGNHCEVCDSALTLKCI